ncbi:MAG: hypothetical protein ACI4GW_05580, partial [Lachnospiraceae bacterium]
KLLNLAGKLYFAQVDIADMIASDMYEVAVTRSLSEGITGYEVQTSSLYGMVTGISEGSLYIDVDNDSHSVISLEGDSDVTREYFMSTGMLSSLYESTVWEEITGEESVSTISILAKASEENIDILLISKTNLSTEIEKLNTDETTKQSIINAVNSGMIVTVPAEEVTMGDWSGTGYIVTNPATGVGEYMISGGLNGGSVSKPATITYLMGILFTVVMLSGLFSGVVGIVQLLVFGGPIASLIGIGLLLLTCVAMICTVNSYIKWTTQYTDYLLEGDVDAAFDMMYDVSSDVDTYAKICMVFGGLGILNQYLNIRFGANLTDVAENISELLRKYTSSKIIEIINKHGTTVEYFSELLQYDRVLTTEEKALVDAVRNEIGEVPAEGTEMVKIIPQADIEKYTGGIYEGIQGFVSEAEFSESLKTLDEVFEGNRLDYASTKFSLSDSTYGKITYLYDGKTPILIPRYPATANNYPYSGKGFTASKNIILPEWTMENQSFVNGEILEVIDAKTGKTIQTYVYHKTNGWIKQ